MLSTGQVALCLAVFRAELDKVAADWQERLHWKASFRVDPSYAYSSLIELYHVTLCQEISWWRRIFLFSYSRSREYLGTIVFLPARDLGWLSPVGSNSDSNFKFSSPTEIPTSVMAFLASREVGQCVAALFGNTKPPKPPKVSRPDDV